MSLLLLFRSAPLPEEETGGGGSGFNWAADPLRKAEVHVLVTATLEAGPARLQTTTTVAYPTAKAPAGEKVAASAALEALPCTFSVACAVDFDDHNARMRAIIISLPE